MQTIDLVSAVVSAGVVGIMILRCGLMANTMLIAEVLWSRRAARATAAAQGERSLPLRPFMVPPLR